jgi:hypothetical protein
MESHFYTAFNQSQIANGKLRRGTFVPHHSTGDAVAYATLRGGSGKSTTSVPKARRHCGTPLSSTKKKQQQKLLYNRSNHFDCCVVHCPTVLCVFIVGSCDFVTG